MTIIGLLEAQGPPPFPYQTDHTQVTLRCMDSGGGQSDSLDRGCRDKPMQECMNLSLKQLK